MTVKKAAAVSAALGMSAGSLGLAASANAAGVDQKFCESMRQGAPDIQVCMRVTTQADHPGWVNSVSYSYKVIDGDTRALANNPDTAIRFYTRANVPNAIHGDKDRIFSPFDAVTGNSSITTVHYADETWIWGCLGNNGKDILDTAAPNPCGQFNAVGDMGMQVRRYYKGTETQFDWLDPKEASSITIPGGGQCSCSC